MASLDPSDDEKAVVEDIRVWEVSASNKTGRVTASRTTLKHHQRASPTLPKVTPVTKRPEVTDIDDVGALTDSESPPKMVKKKRRKRKRVRVHKENDSVREYLISPNPRA